MSKFGVVRLVFGGGGWWRFDTGGGGVVTGWGWPFVSCVVFEVLLYRVTKCFQIFFALPLFFFCRFLSVEFFPLLCSLPWLAVAIFRSGLLCTAELRFSDRWFFDPCSHIVEMCSCKARRFAEAFLGFSILRFFVCFRFFGLLSCAPHSFSFLQLRTCSKIWYST